MNKIMIHQMQINEEIVTTNVNLAYKDLASSGNVGASCQMNVASLFHIFELLGYL